MRILMLTQWFDPEPTFKGLLFAKALRDQGHDVEVLTGFPNYPGGKVYPGYRQRAYSRERLEGVTVHRVPLYPSHDSSAVRRAANYLSFALSSTAASLVIRKPDVVYLYHPPATAAAAALALKHLRGVPFVIDVQDLWPDTLQATGMIHNDTALGVVGWGMRLIYAAAGHVVVLSPGFRKAIAPSVGRRKVSVIPNWADESQMVMGDPQAANSSNREHPFAEGLFTVLFAGTLGAAQGLDTVLAAAHRLRADGVQFVFVGAGIEADRLQRRAAELGLDNVRFLARRPVSAMSPLLAAADALLVHLRSEPLFEITIPSKTQAYLMAGRPILMGVRGDAANLVRDAGAGIVFEPDDAAALAEAVLQLRDMGPEKRAELGRSGVRYYRDHLSLAAGSRAIADVLNTAAQRRPTADFARRALDVTMAGAGLVLFAAPMAVTAALIRTRLGSPVVFRQTRPGRYDRPFEMLKFRTMTDARDDAGELLPDAARITPFGALLRSLSLDELPTLVNVLKGDMSIVGPRPLLPRYTPWFTETEVERLDVRPGVTGWAQVNGRNTAGWDERLSMDVWYVHNRTLRLDLRIIARTVVNVVRRSGFLADPESAMQNLDDERRARAAR